MPVSDALHLETTPLEGLLLLTPRRFGDARGFFSESWNKATMAGGRALIWSLCKTTIRCPNARAPCAACISKRPPCAGQTGALRARCVV